MSRPRSFIVRMIALGTHVNHGSAHVAASVTSYASLMVFELPTFCLVRSDAQRSGPSARVVQRAPAGEERARATRRCSADTGAGTRNRRGRRARGAHARARAARTDLASTPRTARWRRCSVDASFPSKKTSLRLKRRRSSPRCKRSPGGGRESGIPSDYRLGTRDSPIFSTFGSTRDCRKRADRSTRVYTRACLKSWRVSTGSLPKARRDDRRRAAALRFRTARAPLRHDAGSICGPPRQAAVHSTTFLLSMNREKKIVVRASHLTLSHTFRFYDVLKKKMKIFVTTLHFFSTAPPGVPHSSPTRRHLSRSKSDTKRLITSRYRSTAPST